MSGCVAKGQQGKEHKQAQESRAARRFFLNASAGKMQSTAWQLFFVLRIFPARAEISTSFCFLVVFLPPPLLQHAAAPPQIILLAEARKLTASKEILLWMTPSEAPWALQASECSELLDPLRASCWISAQH